MTRNRVVTSKVVVTILGMCAVALLGACSTETQTQVPVGSQVVVTGGTIEGVVTVDGQKTYLGIPYAAPPLGALRWAPTAPIVPWEQVRDATRYGSQCMQAAALSPFYATKRDPMSEDCLFLNVWTRAKTTEDRLPVMVWVHGGALVEGAGELYPGARLSEKGVVVVTINYRLGPFGFFAHPELTAENRGETSGNQGLYDQIAALQWVRDNIASFGGDPLNVTIFGESAGSWSMSALQASPLARGLFHKIIGESGARLLPMWYLKQGTGYAPSAEDRGLTIGKLIAERDEPNLDDLRNIPAGQIMSAYQNDVATFLNFDALVIVDGKLLTEQIAETFSRGAQADVPVLIGSLEDEAMTFDPALLRPATEPDYASLVSAYITARLPHADDRLQLFYPTDTPARARQSYCDLQTDVQFTQPMRDWANKMVNVSSSVYLYWWNWHPSIGSSTALKAFHAADVAYVFGMIGQSPQFGFAIDDLPAERAFADLVMTIWTNFAKTGNPSLEGVIDWPAYTPENALTVVLGADVHVVKASRAEQVKLISESVEKQRADTVHRMP